MKDNLRRKPKSQRYLQQQELPFQGEADRRRLTDRRATTSTKSDCSIMGSRRRVPDRRISNIEVNWLAEDSVIS